MLKRTITALVLVAIFGIAFYLGPTSLSYLIRLLILLAGYEVYRIKKDTWPSFVLILIIALLFGANLMNEYSMLPFVSITIFSFLFTAIFMESVTLDDALLLFFMIIILSLAILSVRKILNLDLSVFVYIIIATFATDTFAYLGGSFFGKRKLIPKISPNKTVEGAIIGSVMSVVLSLLFAKFFLDLDQTLILFASLIIPIISQLGDLTFSMIKRRYKIKDFGFILPGHGGVLDRIDSIVFSLLAFNMLLTILG